MAKRKMRVGEIRCTKNGQAYKKFKNGKVKFIKGGCKGRGR